MTTKRNMEELSPELRRQFEQLRQYYDRVAPPLRSRRPSHRRRQHGKRPKQVRHSIPPSWENRGGKRFEWEYDMGQRVRKATVDLINEVGPRRFTVKEVAKRAGVARSTIYKHFGIKAELLARSLSNYWFCGRTAHLLATERSFYRLVLEALHESGGESVSVTDLLIKFTTTAARSAERDLWLLAAAEGTRSKRPPRIHRRDANRRDPVRDDIAQSLNLLLHAGREPGDGPSAPAPTAATVNTITHVMRALVWYEACLNGPIGDEPRKPDTDRTGRAIEWLLAGAGLSNQRLMPLPPASGNRLPQSVRYQHPTGRLVNELQRTARQVDLADPEAIVPRIMPQTPPLDPPPPLPNQAG